MKLGPYELGPNDTPENGVYCGDARELLSVVPDESISLIITDPVYDRIDDYRWLAETAARVLTPGGNCIAQYAHYYQIPVLNAMDEHLDFVWPLNEFLWGGNASHFKNRIIVKHKPYAWFSKGPRSGGWVFDVIKGGGISKKHHAWGDSPEAFIALIDRLTTEDDVILDPFTGGATVPVACKQLGRCYLAFEIDPDTAAKARHRMALTQPPLLTLVPQQMEFIGGEADE